MSSPYATPFLKVSLSRKVSLFRSCFLLMRRESCGTLPAQKHRTMFPPEIGRDPTPAAVIRIIQKKRWQNWFHWHVNLTTKSRPFHSPFRSMRSKQEAIGCGFAMFPSGRAFGRQISSWCSCRSARSRFWVRCSRVSCWCVGDKPHKRAFHAVARERTFAFRAVSHQ